MLTAGYSVENIDLGCWKPPTVKEIYFGDLQEQKLHPTRFTGIFKLSIKTKTLSTRTKPFDFPKITNSGDFGITKPEEQLELALIERIRKSGSYLITEAHLPPQRASLGMPTQALSTSRRLLSTIKHYAGIHSSYAYISRGCSFTAFHKEDCGLQSLNLHHGGAPKVWIIINPRHSDQFEARIAEHDTKGNYCGQFVRHKSELISPSVIRSWGVEFQVVVQCKGMAIRTEYNTYHCVWNVGTNIAEALNVCEPLWCPSPLYLYCPSSCGDLSFVSLDDMRFKKPRTLEIESIHHATCELPVRNPTSEIHQPLKNINEEVVNTNVYESVHCASYTGSTASERGAFGQPSNIADSPVVDAKNELADVETSDNPSSISHAGLIVEKLGASDQPIIIADSPVVDAKNELTDVEMSDNPSSISHAGLIVVEKLGASDQPIIIEDSPVPDTGHPPTVSRPAIIRINPQPDEASRLDRLVQEAAFYNKRIDVSATKVEDAIDNLARFRAPRAGAIRDAWLMESTVDIVAQRLFYCSNRDDIEYIEGAEFWNEKRRPTVQDHSIRLLFVTMWQWSHYFLVLLSFENKRIYCYCEGTPMPFDTKLIEAARRFNPNIEWTIEKRRNYIENESTADCSLIMFADIEQALNPNVNLPSDGNGLRSRYLGLLLEHARAEEFSQRDGLSILKRECDDKGFSQKWTQPIIDKTIIVDGLPSLLTNFASAQVFVKICELRRKGHLVLSFTNGKSIVSTAMALCKMGDLDILTGSWKFNHGCMMLARRWLYYLIKVKRWMKSRKKDLTSKVRQASVRTDTYVGNLMLLEAAEDDEPNVVKVCSQIQSSHGSTEENLASIRELKRRKEQGEKLFNFITEGLPSGCDTLAMPIWLLVPHVLLDTYLGMDMTTRQQFWLQLKEKRPSLYARLDDISAGLRVVLGLITNIDLRIDTLDPRKLGEESLDSEMLLSCLSVVDEV